MKRQNFHLTEEHIDFLKRYKRDYGVQASEVIRRALEEFIRRHEREAQKI